MYDARALAHDLIEQIGRREHVYGHTCKRGDVIPWDNRSMRHRRRRCDHDERRECAAFHPSTTFLPSG